VPVEITIPDIGDFKDIPVIEVHVKAGDAVAVEEPLVTLESDKATMDVPAPQAGAVVELRIKVGDRVSQGSPILLLQAEGAAPVKPKETVVQEASPAPAAPSDYGSPAGVYDTVDVLVPDIGDFKDVPIIEVQPRSATR
jgi:pyruvate/2-oxoglutarate dehydrogenase complex dihydrolipoamide acyltransferase (E2) component